VVDIDTTLFLVNIFCVVLIFYFCKTDPTVLLPSRNAFLMNKSTFPISERPELALAPASRDAAQFSNHKLPLAF
jgi:hypothetical protein